MWITGVREISETKNISVGSAKSTLTGSALSMSQNAASQNATVQMSAGLAAILGREDNAAAQKTEDEGVQLEISKEAQERYQQQLLEMYKEQAESSKKAAEAYEDLGKLMEIARRIANGDKVPATDEKKLLEYSSDLYQAAKAAAVINAKKKRKEYDALFDEEEEGNKKEQLRQLEREERAGELRSVCSEGTSGGCSVSGGGSVVISDIG